jgi:hypothetical protein
MRELFARDDTQLRRLGAMIAAFTARPPAEQERKQCLLAAMREERDAILRTHRQTTRASWLTRAIG